MKRERFIKDVAKKLATDLDMAGCAIFFLDGEKEYLYGFCGYPDEMWPQVKKVRISMDQDVPVVDAVKNMTPIFIHNAREDDKTLKWLALNFKLLSILIIPLISDDIAIGAALISDPDRIRDINRAEIERIMKITQSL